MTIYDTAWWQAHPEHMPEQRNGTRAWAYELQEQAIADVLRPLSVNSVLEVGCGYGRVTRVVYEAVLPAQYVATDTSENQLEIARDYMMSMHRATAVAALAQAAPVKIGASPAIDFEPLDLNEGDLASLAEEHRDGSQRDLVVCAEVLMHRTPATIERDVSIVASLARRYILTVDWQEEGDRKAEGCYRHDYAALFGKYGFVTVTPLPKIKQAIFLTAVA